MVVAEVALSLVLLVGATLMIRTVLAIQNVISVFAPTTSHLAVPLSPKRYPRCCAPYCFFRGVASAGRALAGVDAAGINAGMHPFFEHGDSVEISGAPRRTLRPVVIHQVSRDYGKVFGIALRRGTSLHDNELASRSRLACNQSFGSQVFPNSDPWAALPVFRVSAPLPPIHG